MLDPNKRNHALSRVSMPSTYSARSSRQKSMPGTSKLGDSYESPSSSSGANKQYSSNSPIIPQKKLASGNKPISLYSRLERSAHNHKPRETASLSSKPNQSAVEPQKVKNLWLIGGLAALGALLVRTMGNGDSYEPLMPGCPDGNCGPMPMMPDGGGFGPVMPGCPDGNCGPMPIVPGGGGFGPPMQPFFPGGCPDGRCPR